MATQREQRSQEHQQTISARRTNRDRARTRTRIGTRFLLVLTCTAAIAFSLVLFFKVRTIEVQGNERYDAQSIAEASGIRLDDNLLMFRKSIVAGKIRSALPYVEQVHISRILPGTVIIEVSETETVYSVLDAENKAWLLNAEGVVVEPCTDEVDDAYCRITGIALENAVVGEKPQAGENNDGLNAAVAVMTALRGTGLAEGISEMDVSKPYDIVLQYQDRFSVWLGGTDQLEYKFRYLKSVLEQLDSYQTGTIDLTFDEEKVARFIPA